MPTTPWRPPFWLIFLDLIGMVSLALGLNLHYAPQAPLIPGLPAAIKVPLLVFGGAIIAMGSIIAVRLVLAHRRSH
ncbi:hypothetical protein M2650_06805 [Luteimonas sp. SX5]|uniref:Uncharacterized protein n=1 Tax=Luteimonas galliterrae TaxID=2940486 RepID=A0ABT0MI29_9GAMM|nr:hypothetical protein [Luteimonas galliterrae]MCL1634343.1 hypothetical protein [Luteimonas galliterrae]